MSSIQCAATAISTFPNQVILDYIISHAHGDQRPYLSVEVLGCPILALLDSGATRTLVGLPGYELFQKLNLNLIKHSVTCSVANGQTCRSIGYVQAPITVMSKTRVIDVLVVPELSHKMILGVDFWKTCP